MIFRSEEAQSDFYLKETPLPVALTDWSGG